MPKKILFLTPYPNGTAASQRFRFELYIEELKSNGYEVFCGSFLDQKTWEVLYKEGFRWRKIWGLILGFARRKWAVLTCWRYDYIFVHRELSPVGPPAFEWWIAKVYRKKIIYDFDDAIWLRNTTKTNSLAARMKWHSKVPSICKWSYKVSCGNEFLAKFASQFNENVLYNPTTIDTENLHLPNSYENSIPVIGWTGTHSTLKYLKIILKPLAELAEKYEFIFQVIADKKPDFEIPNLKFKQWSKSTEIDDLNEIDIGVMPLEKDEWSEGKCGFKALQFMALEKPVLVSPVGVNDMIVEEGASGFHCQNEEEWILNLEKLLLDKALRKRLGQVGRIKVIKEFSVKSNAQNFLSLFT